MNTFEVLERSQLFRDLDHEQLSMVEKMCAPEVFEPGTIICKQGTEGVKMYVIEEGLVGVILEVGLMAKRQVQSAARFESFGWSAMIEPYIYTVTVKAREKTRALAFNGNELRDFCLANPATP